MMDDIDGIFADCKKLLGKRKGVIKQFFRNRWIKINNIKNQKFVIFSCWGNL